jgi:hypothetical protein
MRYLQALNWVFVALGATMVVNLGVVALLYSIYLDEASRYRTDLSTVTTYLLLFFAVMVTAAAAAVGHRWHKFWRWPAELLLALAVARAIWQFLPR